MAGEFNLGAESEFGQDGADGIEAGATDVTVARDAAEWGEGFEKSLG